MIGVNKNELWYGKPIADISHIRNFGQSHGRWVLKYGCEYFFLGFIAVSIFRGVRGLVARLH